MSLRPFLVLVGLLLLPATAGAVTVHEIIELTKAGLSDEVLTALIDADRTIFTLDKDQILELKEAGVSKAVLLKMLRSRREFDSPPPEAAPEPASGPTATASADEVPGIVIIGAQPAPAPPPACSTTFRSRSGAEYERRRRSPRRFCQTSIAASAASSTMDGSDRA